MIRTMKKPVALTLGTYVPLEYDAKLELDGLTWWRVESGFGGGFSGPYSEKIRYKREDWVLELPAGTIGVSVCRDSNETTWIFGHYETREEAMRAAVKDAVTRLFWEMSNIADTVHAMNHAYNLLTRGETDG